VPFDVQATGDPLVLPVDDAGIVRLEGANARWFGAPESLRAAVRRDGFAVLPSSDLATRVGDFYLGLARSRVPVLITLDALFHLVHIARDRAFADVETLVLGAARNRLLSYLDRRLESEQRGCHADLVAGYRLARVLVSTAIQLQGDARVLPPDIAAEVASEVAAATAHAGLATSASLGVPIDYSLCKVRGALEDGDDKLPGAFRAGAWLAYAPFAAHAQTEAQGGPLDVGQARVQTRAALLLTRLVQIEVDAQVARAWSTIARASELAVGPPADLTASDVAQIALGAGIDVRDAAAIADVVRLDHVRHALARARPGATFRLAGLARAADAVVMQAAASADPSKRAMPSGKDVVRWLTSKRAQGDLESHVSFYDSALFGIAAYLAPSAANATLPAAGRGVWTSRKVEAALNAWTELRHDSLAYARLPLASFPLLVDDASAPVAPVVLVEPHPEAIAALLGLVRHLERGFTALAVLPAEAPSRALLQAVSSILATALGVAIDEAADHALAPDLARDVARMPMRLAAIEAGVAQARAGEIPLVADVHTDPASGRVLEEATGNVDELYAVVREPGTGRWLLTVGAAVAHYEFEEPPGQRLSDSDWRTRLARGEATRAEGQASSGYICSTLAQGLTIH
jgi:hypothetical protein